MTDPEGIQKEPSPPLPPSESPAPAVHKCPHCDHTLTRKDVEIGLCWYCNKRLADPIDPHPPARAPFLATFVFGIVGAFIGLMVGYFLTGGERGSWTTSLCGGIGFASGGALARALFTPRK
jgi:hypothetical protein